MSDIVERLAERLQVKHAIGGNCHSVPNAVIEDAMAEIRRLRAALRDAREMVECWSCYASDYFKDKHGLADDLALLDAVLTPAQREDA